MAKKTTTKSETPETPATPRIVSAVGTAAQASKATDPAAVEFAKRMEAAMAGAVKQALADGVAIEDSDEIRKRILAAQDAVLNPSDSARAAESKTPAPPTPSSPQVLG